MNDNRIRLNSEWIKQLKLSRWDDLSSFDIFYRRWAEILFGKDINIEWFTGRIHFSRRVAIPITELL